MTTRPMPEDNPFFDLVFLMTLLALAIFAVCSCAPPTVEEFLGKGVDCTVTITMPDEPIDGREEVTVKARFTDCREVQ